MITMLHEKNSYNEHFKNPKRICSILLTETTAAQNEVSLGYHKVCRLYFQAVVFAATIISVM